VRKLAPFLKVVHLKDVAAGGEDNVLIGQQGIAKIPAAMEEFAQSVLPRVGRHRIRERRGH